MHSADSFEIRPAQADDANLAKAKPSSSADDWPLCTLVAGVGRPGARLLLLRCLLIGGVALVAYSAVDHFSKQANADRISFAADLGGGFLAFAMSDTEPGFIVLSAMDQEQVDVSAQQARSLTTATQTVVEVRTPRER